MIPPFSYVCKIDDDSTDNYVHNLKVKMSLHIVFWK